MAGELVSPQSWTLDDLTLFGGRYYSDEANIPGGGEPDLFSYEFETVVIARDDTGEDKLTALNAIGINQGMFEEPTAPPGTGHPGSGGYVWTEEYDTLGIPPPPSGNTRGLVQEAYPIALRRRATITGATIANPTVYTVASTAAFTNGQEIALEVMPGDFAPHDTQGGILTIINGTTFTVSVGGTPRSSVGFGAYTSGGRVATPYINFQPEPYIGEGDQSNANTHIPARHAFQWLFYLRSTFTADIGAGAQEFTNTFPQRNKLIYYSREVSPDPPYGASYQDGVSYIPFPGNRGYEDNNARLSVPGSFPTDEMFMAFDTGSIGSFGPGGANDTLAAQPWRLYQNVNNTKKFVTDTWQSLRYYADFSGQYAALIVWMWTDGDEDWTEISRFVDPRHPDAEALGGGTEDFEWEIPSELRTGHKQWRLNSVIGGFVPQVPATPQGDSEYITDALHWATSHNLLPNYGA